MSTMKLQPDERECEAEAESDQQRQTKSNATHYLDLHGKEGLNMKEAVNQQPGVRRQGGEAPMTREQDLCDDVAQLSEVTDAPESYS